MLTMAILAASLVADPGELRRFEKSQIHMGMSIGIVLYAGDETVANRAFDAAFSRFDELNAIFSDYDSTSETLRLCAQTPTPEPVAVSPELFHVLAAAKRFSERTDGAFDVTVGPLTKLWRRARRQKELPPAETIRELLPSVGHQHLVLDETRRTVRLMRPKMRLDFGAIVAGYAADEAVRVMREQGVTRTLVNASGDLAVGDPPPGESAWRVEIAALNPRDKPERAVWLSNRGVSTSGDVFQFLEINGQRYSHILDAHTGYGVTRRCSATVIAPTGMEADALATALCILPPEKGLDLIARTPGTAALIVYVDGEQTRTVASPNFERFASRDK